MYIENVNSPVDIKVMPVKILMGRKAAYMDADEYDEVPGYSKPSESEHDFFVIGHTSTFVSLACDLAKVRDLKGEKGNVIAVMPKTMADYTAIIRRAYDQLSQDLCINDNPALILVFWGSLSGMNDVTHLCLFDIPVIGNIPNMVYLAPTCREEYFAMLEWGIRQTEHPVDQLSEVVASRLKEE